LTLPPLTPGEDSIHIWSIALHASVELERAFEETLSNHENLRRQGFANSTLRRRFTLSHGVLRVLLSRYLDTSPEQIVFGYGLAGKPFVENDRAWIQFNASHSDDLAVYAFGSKRRLGVDIERIRSMPDLNGVAKLFFNKNECAEILSLEEAERTEAFFRCWTRKEAYLKAVGCGFSVAPESFEVSLRPEQPAALRSLPLDDACRSWKIHDIARSDYAGAVVFDGADCAIECKPVCAAEDLADSLVRRRDLFGGIAKHFEP